MVQVRIGYQRIFTDNIKGLNFSAVGFGHHFRNLQSRFGGQTGDVPGPFHFFNGIQVVHRLVAGKHVGQAAHVARPLNVVLPAQRIDPATTNPHIAA
jgi:hypothetical protein